MMLMTKEQEEKLVANFLANDGKESAEDHRPVIKLFGGGACTWLLTEYCPDSRTFFGLCDMGAGFPELGYVSRDELEEIRFKPLNLPVERERHFTADKTIGEYATIAKKEGRIVT